MRGLCARPLDRKHIRQVFFGPKPSLLRLDLAVLDFYGHTVLLYRGNGDGTFQEPVTSNPLSTVFIPSLPPPGDALG